MSYVKPLAFLAFLPDNIVSEKILKKLILFIIFDDL